MTTEKELRVKLGKLARAYGEKNNELFSAEQLTFVNELNAFLRTNPSEAEKIRKLYERWVARATRRQNAKRQPRREIRRRP